MPQPFRSDQPLLRAIATVGGATVASRLFGFARDVGIAALLGAGAAADAFFAVLQLANFFRRLLAESALNAAFVPVWLRIKATEGDAAAWRFFRGVFEAMALLAGAFALIGLFHANAIVGVIAPGFDAERAALGATYLAAASPYAALAAVIAVFAAVLNAEHRVGAVSLGIVVFNAILLLALGIAWTTGATLPARAGTVLAHGIVAGGLAQFAVIFVGFLRLTRTSMSGGLALTREIARFFVLAVPGLVAAGIPQLKLIAGAMIASSSAAAVSWLYYANRLYELPLGVASIVISAVLAPRIAAAILDGDAQGTARAQSHALELGLGLVLPAAAGFAVLAHPLAMGLFERGAFGAADSLAVAAALAAICAGLPGHVTEKVMGGIAFAHEDTRTPMLVALAGLALTVTLGLMLFPRYGATGIAAAIAVSGWFDALLLAAILARRGWLTLDPATPGRLVRIVAATVAMGLAVAGAAAALASTIRPGLPALTVTLLLTCGGALLYGGLLHALRVIDLRRLRHGWR